MGKGKERQRFPSSRNNQQVLQASPSWASISTQEPSLAHRHQQQDGQTDNHEGFDSEQVRSKFEAKFGPTGSRWLSVIGSLLGIAHYKIKDIEIICDGEQLKGNYTIGNLMESGDLANKGLRSNKNNRNLFYMSHIAAAMPHSAFLFLEALDEDEETVSRIIGYDIPTSLPVSLRYFHAADLPLGPKTRKAHLFWSINFATLIKSKFDGHIYNRCAQNADNYLDIERVMTLLNFIESTIALTTEEKMIKWSPIHY